MKHAARLAEWEIATDFRPSLLRSMNMVTFKPNAQWWLGLIGAENGGRLSHD